jgi:hypothetical protein
MRNSLEELIGKESVQQFVIPKDLVRHIVVSIDNMPEEKVAERLRPMIPTPGSLRSRVLKRRRCSILPITGATNLWCN